jgi:hypothetical protein
VFCKGIVLSYGWKAVFFPTQNRYRCTDVATILSPCEICKKITLLFPCLLTYSSINAPYITVGMGGALIYGHRLSFPQIEQEAAGLL